MPEHSWEKEREHRSSAPYDYPRPRNRNRNRSPEYPEYYEAVKTTAVSHRGNIPYQVRETQRLQVTAGTKRRRVEDDYEDEYRSPYTEDDEAYVWMKVTKREQKEILQRRTRQDDTGRAYYDNRDYRNNARRRNGYHGNDQDSEEKRNDSTRTMNKVSLFNNAENFSINGGRTLVVGGDQTIADTILPRSKFQRSTERDFSPPPQMQDRSDSSTTAKSTTDIEVTAYANAKDFEISGGEFSVVKGNSTITSTRFHEDSNNSHPGRRNLVNRRDIPKHWERSPSTASRAYTSLPSEQAAFVTKPRISSTQSLGSGASLLGFSSGVTISGTKAYPGSFSAVGGNQTITIGASSDSEGSDYYG